MKSSRGCWRRTGGGRKRLRRASRVLGNGVLALELAPSAEVTSSAPGRSLGHDTGKTMLHTVTAGILVGVKISKGSVGNKRKTEHILRRGSGEQRQQQAAEARSLSPPGFWPT